ncbi:MAG TPA: type III secretion system export apparatus subunit SctU [Terriglobales bacterium]|nr:type III secretion system export apparatus subunit SctU [Terriglobales bacterium]
MSGDKTEQPTPKKLNDARKKGQVFKSKDIVQALLFATAAAILAAGGPSYVLELRDLLKEFFQPEIMKGDMALQPMLARMGYAWSKFLLLSTPLMGALMIVAAAGNFMQVKALFAPEVIKPKFDKLNPMSGFKNTFFSPKAYIELVKTLVKAIVVFALIYGAIKASMRDIIPTAGMDLNQTAALTGHLLTSILYKVAAVFVVLGGADFMIQKKMFMKNMMMSKEDVKNEYKESEGDPHVKHQRKHMFQQLMHESVAHHVPKATVVVANPTHYAIALRYDEASMQAPRVTAKGQDSMALRIQDIARQYKVPIVRNIGLAHALYDLEIGHDIPEDLYEAVAEVLNFVYQLAAAEE